MFEFMLLAAQASGLAANLWQTRKENKFDLLGVKMQQKQLDLQLQQEQLASSQESLYNMRRLQDVMATQRAIFAARGQSASQGTNYFIGQESVNKFNSDEQARKLALSFNKYRNKATQSLMNIEYAGRKQARANKNIGETLNMVSFNNMLGGSSGGINDFLSNLWNKNGSSNSGL